MEEKKMHGLRARLDYVVKHSNLINRFYKVCGSAFMKLWGFFIPIDNKLVLLTGHTRKYNDSPRVIYEYMLGQSRFKGLKYVWGLEDPDSVEIPGNPIKVKSDTFKYFYYSLKAKYWIACVNIERGLHYKKKNCIYLNTNHGTALNTMGNGGMGRKDYDFSYIDIFCYESEYQKQHCIDDYNVREEALIPTGYPRNDTLYYTTPEEVIEIKKRLSIPLDKKVIMYAPTWRDSTDKGKTCAIKPPVNVRYWEERLKDDYVVIFRTHAYTNKLLGLEFNDTIRDFSSYPVVNDLFKVSDILISDYSSCISDFCILERPIICFAYDYEEYKIIRGLCLDFEKEMPNGVKRTEQEVIDYILTMNYEDECKKTKLFKEKYTNIGGHATEICVNALFGKDTVY